MIGCVKKDVCVDWAMELYNSCGFEGSSPCGHSICKDDGNSTRLHENHSIVFAFAEE